VAHAYDDGDQLFLFGFSRGAYTARSLAGMIAACGLPASDKFTDQAVEDAFSAYRARTNRAPLVDELNKRYGNRPVQIAMVGVWETVGALGIPGDLFVGFDEQIYGLNGRLRVWRSRGGVAASPEEWLVRLSSASRRGGPVDDEGADDVGVAYAND